VVPGFTGDFAIELEKTYRTAAETTVCWLLDICTSSDLIK
jgi:hypothetical protein